MGSVTTLINVLVTYLCVASCAAGMPRSVNATCRNLIVECYTQPGLDSHALKAGLTAITQGFAHFNFHFSPIAEEEALNTFCSAWDKWTDCLRDCMDEHIAVWQQLQPVSVFCSHRKDFLASPSCWEGKTVVTGMKTCADKFNIDKMDCKSLKQSLKCMQRFFEKQSGCSLESKRFISAVLDDYLKKDYRGICKENKT